jgi:steroid delta-isomerase-like uncharacterized protein
MSQKDDKAVVRQFLDASFTKEKVSELDQLISSDFVYHHATGKDLPKEAYKQMVMMSHNAFPDASTKIDDLFGEGNKISCRFTIAGTQTGEYQGIPPSGNTLNIEAINNFRVADGKIAECWSQFNVLRMMQQLGVIPPMGAPKK